MIEPLESRTAPAVILAVTASPTGIVISEEAANAGASALKIFTDAQNGLFIEPVDAVTLFRVGGQLVGTLDIPNFTGNITARLGAGNDTVALTGFLPGTVSLDLGAGTNGVQVTDAKIGGKFTVKAGTGADTVAFLGTKVELLGTTNLAFGDGENVLSNETTSLLAVSGDLLVTSGKDADTMDLRGKDVQVLGRLSFNTGAGTDSATMTLSGQLQVTGSAALRTSGPSPVGSFKRLEATSILIGGGLIMENKGNSGSHELIGRSIVIGGGATFSNGVVDIDAGGVGGSFLLGGNLTGTALFGGSFVVTSFESGSIAGAVNLNGYNNVTMRFSGSIAGPVKAALGATQDPQFELGGASDTTPPLYVNAVTVTAKKGSANYRLANVVAQGPLLFTGTADADVFIVDDTLVLGSMRVDLGAGDDQFFIENNATSPREMRTHGVVTLLGGIGNDTFTFGGSTNKSVLTALATITVDGGANTDTLIRNAGGDYDSRLVPLNIEVGV